jgi:nucleotide-binding universal stress UspA family protein
VPEGVPMNLFHHPIIAWNGSLEAARAVGFALPFLTECESVDIFAAPEHKHCTETDELQRYLSWHGVVAQRVLVEESHPIGMSLLAQASSNQAGLVVMGAYTHGHYRQFLFGGMTRYVMGHAATPVLLAHQPRSRLFGQANRECLTFHTLQEPTLLPGMTFPSTQ